MKKNYGRAVKVLASLFEVKQNELAKMCRVSEGTLSGMASGYVKKPNKSTIKKIEKNLNIPHGSVEFIASQRRSGSSVLSANDVSFYYFEIIAAANNYNDKKEIDKLTKPLPLKNNRFSQSDVEEITKMVVERLFGGKDKISAKTLLERV